MMSPLILYKSRNFLLTEHFKLMEIVTWKDEVYSVNNEAIDNQHKKIFSIINQLFTYMSKGESKDKLREVLNELVDYAQYHFNSEEAHFCKLKGFPEQGKHIDEHQQFVEKVQQFQSDFIQGKKMLTMDVFIFIKNWINTHIKKCDRKMCQFHQIKNDTKATYL